MLMDIIGLAEEVAEDGNNPQVMVASAVVAEEVQLREVQEVLVELVEDQH
jgi:hypothetical protein